MTLKKTLHCLEKQLMHYRLQDFEERLSPDFREFGTSGTVYDKASILQLVTEQGIANIPFEISNFHVASLSDTTAHVTYETTSLIDGTISLRSSIWRYERDRWQLYFHQGTRTFTEGE